jgi:L-sorbose 1-phosphate reductase
MTSAPNIPESQQAIQLVGKERVERNPNKPVFRPGPHQILAKVEAVGLCFSDMKLLSQFSEHPRKAEIVSGIEAGILSEIPSYVPGDKPTVPGHEVVCQIVEIGSEVKHHRVGERVLVQTDYRSLLTRASNGAFGYNFEGALQEYVLMDERMVIDDEGRRFLIPAPPQYGASTIALVEPWACVEHSYVFKERKGLLPGGRLVIVAEEGMDVSSAVSLVNAGAAPRQIVAYCFSAEQRKTLEGCNPPPVIGEMIDAIEDESCDDILYFGAVRTAIERLNDKLATGGMINIITSGRKIGEAASVGVGRVHYGLTRWIGTTGIDAADSYKNIPENGEIRPGDRILIVGAAGPMGQMHVIRAVASGLSGLEIVATDFDDHRLQALGDKISAIPGSKNSKVTYINPQNGSPGEGFSYIVLMAPVAPLVAEAIKQSRPGCLINIFAGIPSGVRHPVDLDTYIENRCFMFGTSGSKIEDMHRVLEKIVSEGLNTDLSLDAISGMAGAVDGLEAVKNRTLAGKIIVYPQLHDLGLIPLSELHKQFPTVAEKLDHGYWCKAAEEELLRVAGKQTPVAK